MCCVYTTPNIKSAIFFFFYTFTFQLLDKPWLQVSVAPSSPRFLPSLFIAHRFQQFYCSSIFHRVLLTHALALSANQFVHKKKPQRIYTSMHSAGLELTKLTYTRLEDNLIRHRGDLQPHGISHGRSTKVTTSPARCVAKIPWGKNKTKKNTRVWQGQVERREQQGRQDIPRD